MIHEMFPLASMFVAHKTVEKKQQPQRESSHTSEQ